MTRSLVFAAPRLDERAARGGVTPLSAFFVEDDSMIPADERAGVGLPPYVDAWFDPAAGVRTIAFLIRDLGTPGPGETLANGPADVIVNDLKISLAILQQAAQTGEAFRFVVGD